ncbi:MAG: hypothetical protein ACOC44_13700 [Promethearchaeia archaeon]
MSSLRDSKKNWIIRVCKIAVVLNLLTVCFGIAFQVISTYNIFFDVTGFLLVLSWIINLYLIYELDKNLVKTNKMGKIINRYTYYFLIFFIAAIFLILIGVLFQSIILRGDIFVLGTILYHVNISIGFIGIAALGIYLSILTLLNIDKREVFEIE